MDLAWEKDYIHIYIYIYIFERRIMCVLVCNRIIGMIVCLVIWLRKRNANARWLIVFEEDVCLCR